MTSEAQRQINAAMFPVKPHEEDSNTNTLVENIVRSAYKSDWVNVVREIDTRGVFADTERVVVVTVSSYSALELIGEAAHALDFTIEKNLINDNSHVVGQPHAKWKVTRTWWFTLTDTDKNDPNNYPSATPKGTTVRFIYSETRNALAF